MTETAITAAVLAELARAEATHDWSKNNLVKRCLIMTEEAGEVAKAVLNHDEKNEPLENVRLELIQTAAMCYRMLKGLDREEELY